MADIGGIFTILKGAKFLIVILGLFLPLSIKQLVVHENSYNTLSLSRTSFPHDFIFGAASSAYQVITFTFIPKLIFLKTLFMFCNVILILLFSISCLTN